jgi:uncharacterized protein
MDELDLIESPLCTNIEIDGHLLRVEIYGSEPNKWILEVVDEENASTVWDDPFESDEAALAEFHRFISMHGVAGILNNDTEGAA